MNVQHLTVDGMNMYFKIVKILGDGACLFSALPYLIHDNVSMAIQIRKAIVRHVCNEWKRFKCFTQGPSGVPYGTKRLYYTEMSKPYTYGSICKAMAAGEIFPYKFQVYQDGTLIAVFGDAFQGTRRLWFTGNFNEGHFDALVPSDAAIINSIQLSQFNEPPLLTSTEQIGCDKYFSCQHGYNCKSDVCKPDESTSSIQSKKNKT
ncbi:hypothetical protein TNCT_346161 [Trichonephila clavata]|uniref:OTU domain-containing protein n=1 Tax=Trichonephila clavata TaxID=2740835 RepID=A0A8X6K7H8_TRICU|nr:hypothetical protein TNCT_346161 [Trichonephila clavata]